ncbi:FMN-binding negative transcriptional regulator [Achromobacter aloeverae]|uniref:FMN-binding negative transcriptional regulator n=1 Tax=Achromobacter aloeverae TaxID=1750518 RepID=A0A4Q1HN63_9BURK|nr:FMN-binding negative transcriptional regulator [Achromobacter aloeverae]RXN92418.1 FMN-binding negative transcriptional regulator [Achromobacter aloeverae]
MYTPPAYAEHDPATLRAFMRAHPFATLVTATAAADGGAATNATHLPFLLRQRDGAHLLVTHLARANPQWRDLQAGAQALVLFQGPHAFISPGWYHNRQTFPTWNYTAVHVRGRPRLVEAPEDVRGVLQATVDTYDAPLGGPWRFDAMPDTLVLPRLKAIAALEIPLTHVEGKMKLNQDKSVADRLGVIQALERRGDPQSMAVAGLMRGQADMAGEDSCVADARPWT